MKKNNKQNHFTVAIQSKIYFFASKWNKKEDANEEETTNSTAPLTLHPNKNAKNKRKKDATKQEQQQNDKSDVEPSYKNTNSSSTSPTKEICYKFI